MAAVGANVVSTVLAGVTFKAVNLLVATREEQLPNKVSKHATVKMVDPSVGVAASGGCHSTEVAELSSRDPRTVHWATTVAKNEGWIDEYSYLSHNSHDGMRSIDGVSNPELVLDRSTITTVDEHTQHHHELASRHRPSSDNRKSLLPARSKSVYFEAPKIECRFALTM